MMTWKTWIPMKAKGAQGPLVRHQLHLVHGGEKPPEIVTENHHRAKTAARRIGNPRSATIRRALDLASPVAFFIRGC